MQKRRIDLHDAERPGGASRPCRGDGRCPARPVQHRPSAFVEGDSDRTFLAESIDQAMGKLSPGARMVFVLHDIEGYTHDEIGKELGITSGGSKSQLFKARAKLRRLLAHLVDESRAGTGMSHAPV